MILGGHKMTKWAVLVGGALGFAVTCFGKVETEPYPLEYWALRPYISDVQMSPMGDRLALLKRSNKDASPILEIYGTSDLSAQPFRMNADHMDIVAYNWLSDDTIGFVARQQIRQRITGFNEGAFGYSFVLLNVDTEELKTFDEDQRLFVENVLPAKPNHVIIAYDNYDRNGPASKLNQALRPLAYWEMDLTTGAKKLLIRGKLRLGRVEFDQQGFPRLAEGFDERTGYQYWYYRDQGQSDWDEIYRAHEDDWEVFEVGGIDEENPGMLFVYANNGENTVGLWHFNVESKEFVELIYGRSDVDVGALVHHSDRWAHQGVETGISWWKDRRHVEYWDAEEEAIHKQLNSAIPHAYDLSFRRSRDGQTVLVRNHGPRDPGTYYLLKEGKLSNIGTRNPLLKSEDLAEVRYITYEARDGRRIPAYVTVPGSEPPFPLVVLPHGGPFVTEVVVYDEWSQMLANNGYLVLQPQYRGSTGYGLEFYQSAFIDGGQGGYKMQDDKDDGALYLVEQGLADRERIAMFGWSYGGYAALAAAARTPQIYQCVVAGAAVADNNQQVNHYRYETRGVQRLEQLSMWDDSISPIEEASKVNVPMLIIHGDIDQRVEVKHSRRYVRELERFEKDFEYIELEGADHFSDTLTYDHKLTVYGSLIRFLRDDCGLDGL